MKKEQMMKKGNAMKMLEVTKIKRKDKGGVNEE